MRPLPSPGTVRPIGWPARMGPSKTESPTPSTNASPAVRASDMTTVASDVPTRASSHQGGWRSASMRAVAQAQSSAIVGPNTCGWLRMPWKPLPLTR